MPARWKRASARRDRSGRRSCCPWAVAILVGVGAALTTPAEEDVRPRLGLVLGGGGARGGAHVGVLRIMEELRIPVDYVAGTSIGALVGALYSAGYSPDEIARIIGRIPWDEAFRDAPDRRRQSFRQKEDDALALFPFELGAGRKGISGRSGIIAGTRLDFIFRTLTLEAGGAGSFDQLRIPYRAVAMDLKTGDMVVLDHGDLARAMRASMSVPGVFTPVETDGRVLTDGGTVRNIPVDVARAMGAEKVIAIDVGTRAREEVRDLPMVAVLSQTVAAMSERNRQRSREEIGPEDLLITPELEHLSAGDFAHIQEAIAAGEAAARAHEAELRRYSVSEAEYARFLHRQRRESAGLAPTLRVDSIEIEGVRRVPLELVRRRIKTRAGEPLRLTTLSRDLDRIWQFGEFESVGYRIDRDGDENRLVIEAREKPWGPGYLRFGLSIESDFEGDSSFAALGYFRRANVNRLGAEWKTVVALGNPFQAVTEFYQPLRPGGSWFVAPRLSWSRDKTETYLVNGDHEDLKVSERLLGLDLGLQLRNYGEIRLGALRGKLRVEPTTTTTLEPLDREVGGPLFQLKIDQQDDTFFPTQGNHSQLALFLSREGFGADDEYDRLEVRTVQAGTLGRNTFVGGIVVGTGMGSTIPFYAQHSLGGFLNLSGIERDALRGNVKVLFTLGDYWRIKKLGALGKVYAGAALQAGNVWASGDDVALADLIYSGTLFVGVNTKLFPMFLGFGLAEGGRTAGYLTVGRVF